MNNFNQLKILLIIASPPLIWGILFIMAKPIFQEVSPIYFAIIRYLPSALIVLIVLYFLEGKEAFKVDKNFFLVAFIGAFSMSGFNVLAWIGVNLSSGVMGAIFQPIMPLIAIIISFILFKQKFNYLTFIVIIIAFLGVFLAASNGNPSFITKGKPLGVFLIFIGSVMAVFTGVLAPKFKSFSVLRYTAITNLGGVSAFCLFALLETKLGYVKFPAWQNILAIKWELLYTSFFAGVLPMFIWYKGLKTIGAVNVMLVNNVIPVITIIGSILIGFGVSNYEVIGVAVIVFAMILHYFNVKRTVKIS